ncbi:MAG TPA: hypothetical protein VFM18_11140 [Methanosarcina sp.]|nr:hypothetical protein [Methanosarcina sp.]
MAKFRVGDEVRIVNHGYGLPLSDVGGVYTIEEISETGYITNLGYKLKDYNGESVTHKTWGFVGEQSFELVERPFTKADLRTGMVLELVTSGMHEDLGVVMLGVEEHSNPYYPTLQDVIIYSKGGFDELNYYDDTLAGKYHKVMRVYKAPADFKSFIGKGDLIWERKEKSEKELKKEELSAKMDKLKKQITAIQEEYNKL